MLIWNGRYAGAVLVVTAEGKCIIKVFPPEEDTEEGRDATTNGQPTTNQVPLVASLRLVCCSCFVRAMFLHQIHPDPAAVHTLP